MIDTASRSSLPARSLRGLVILAVCTLAGGLHADDNNKSAFPFFVFDNGLNGVPDPPRVLGELGYDGIGVRGLDIGGLVQSYEQAGLKVFSTYVGCRLDQTPPYDPQFADRIAKLKGTDVILWLTVTGGKSGQEDARAAAVVGEIADMAARADLRVALYPHTGFYIATTADALRIASLVDRSNVGVSLNLCHELMTDQGPQLEATIRRALPQLMLVSINGADDKRPGYGWDRLIQPLGRGDYDVCGFLQQLQTAGYRGPIGLQCYAVKGDPLENLRRSMAAWRQYQNRLGPLAD